MKKTFEVWVETRCEPAPRSCARRRRRRLQVQIAPFPRLRSAARCAADRHRLTGPHKPAYSQYPPRALLFPARRRLQALHVLRPRGHVGRCTFHDRHYCGAKSDCPTMAVLRETAPVGATPPLPSYPSSSARDRDNNRQPDGSSTSRTRPCHHASARLPPGGRRSTKRRSTASTQPTYITCGATRLPNRSRRSTSCPRRRLIFPAPGHLRRPRQPRDGRPADEHHRRRVHLPRHRAWPAGDRRTSTDQRDAALRGVARAGRGVRPSRGTRPARRRRRRPTARRRPRPSRERVVIPSF